MTQYSDEKLSAYLDGELPSEERAEIAAALTSNAELKARLDHLQQADSAVRAAFSGIDDRPMPAQVLEMLAAADETEAGAADDSHIVGFPPAGRKRPSFSGWAMPLAASIALAIGLGLGVQLAPGGRSGDALQLAGMITPSDPLYDVLETGRSAVDHPLAGDAHAQPILTFRTAAGSYCREFRMSDADTTVRALACREDGDWRVNLAVADEPGGGGSVGRYETAAADRSAVLDPYIDGIMADAPLDAAQEEMLINSGWSKK